MSKKAAPTDFNFNALVELCRRTHEELRSRAIRSVDIAMVVRNWLIGWYIVEYKQTGADRAKYGSRLIERLAAKLHLKGSSATNLRKFRQFYREYPIQQTLSVESGKAPSAPLNWQTVSVELFQRFSLSWSHYVTLLSIDNPEERRFYEIEAREGSWGSRNLERQISSSLYERLALSRDKEEIRRLSQKGQTVEKASDIIKNPVVLEFLGLEEKPRYSEEELETTIIDKLEHFLLELGKGFLFESRQKRFTFDNDHFYVDLVFYNRLLRCYVLLDLKRDKLTHQDLGQMQMYVNYFDRHVKTEDELPTIGIVLCHRKNDALVELTLPKEANIFASKYLLYLPSKEVLKAQLQKIEAELKEESEEWRMKNDSSLHSQLSTFNSQLPKAYKQTEVGVIPEEWKVKSLSCIGRVIRGSSPRPKGDNRFYGGSVPRLMVEDVTRDRKFVTPAIDFLTVEGAKRSRPCKRGTLTVACSGTPTVVGLPSILAVDACIHDGMLALVQLDRSVEPEYLFYRLTSLQEQLHASATHGGTFVNLTTAGFGAFTITLPPLPEQRAIAGTLSDVDELIGALDQLIAKKRDLKQAAMQQLLTGQIRLPGFHGEWEVRTLGDLFTFSGGFSASRDQLSSEGHCYLHYGDIHKSSKTFIDVRSDYQDIPKLDIPLNRVSPVSLLEEGDVVFVDASEDDEGTSRHVVIVNKDKTHFISGLHTIVAKSKTNELDHQYRRYCFQTTAIKRQFYFYAVGTKVSGISKTNITKLTLPVPPLAEQTAIAEVLSDMDAELAALTQRRDKTRALKQGMMQELLTGRTRLV